MSDLNERLLDAWLSLSSTVSNERIVCYMPFNEAFICHLLYNQLKLDPNQYLTATELCEKTRMLKSQMNKILNGLEKKGLIQKMRSSLDKRVVFIVLCQDQLEIYQNEHTHIIGLIDDLIEKLGIEEANQVLQTFHKVSDTFNQLINERSQYGH